MNIAWGPCRGCYEVMVPPAEEGGTGVCARCTVALEGIRGAHLCQGRDQCGGLVFTCPECERTSHHPEDARQGFCGACHDWTGAPERIAGWAVQERGRHAR